MERGGDRGMTTPGFSELAARGLDRLLGDLEQSVMQILWGRGEASVRDVLTTLNGQRGPDRQLAYTTAMTVMSRLVDKSLLERRLVGKAHIYRVLQSRDAYLTHASEQLARQLVADFGDAAIAGFVSVLSGVAPEQLARLQARRTRGAPTRE